MADGKIEFSIRTLFDLILLLYTWEYTTNTENEHGSKQKILHQDKVFVKIKSSAALSLGRIEHSNLSGCLQNPTLSFKKQL